MAQQGTVMYAVPIEVDAWIRERAERLAQERGHDKPLKLAAVVRELPAIVDAAEALGIRPAANDTRVPA